MKQILFAPPYCCDLPCSFEGGGGKKFEYPLYNLLCWIVLHLSDAFLHWISWNSFVFLASIKGIREKYLGVKYFFIILRCHYLHKVITEILFESANPSKKIFTLLRTFLFWHNYSFLWAIININPSLEDKQSVDTE